MWHDLFDLLPANFDPTDCCSRQYWRWEDRVTTYLRSQGWGVGRWVTLDGDSFGPLVRGVTIYQCGEFYNLSYG